ncbi:MAG: McrB family protein, partial [Floccifex sp.]
MNKEQLNLETIAKSTYLIGEFDAYSGVYTMKNSSNVLMFHVFPLCDEPIAIKSQRDSFKQVYIEENKYSGFVRDQKNNGLPVGFNDRAHPDDQKEELEDFYNDNYIIFQPVYNYEHNTNEYHKNLRIIDVIDRKDLINDEADDYYPEFKVVPRVNLDRKTFEKKLKNHEYFEMENYPGEIYDGGSHNVDYVLCDSILYFCDGWEYNNNNTTNWRNGENSIIKYKLIDRRESLIVQTRYINDFVFIETSYLNQFENSFEALVFEEENIIQEVEIEEAEFEETIDNTEANMLLYFKNKLLNDSLFYDFEDIVNLHTCIKSSQLTILAGMSGTGKTQLALKYAKMIDASESNNTLLFLPVSPSYSEPDDILGYLNPQNGLYKPSETGLVDFLIGAEKNPNKMHLVIFDEMNLAQIEYWFSPFISILEKDEDSRYLTLYNQKSHCINDSSYKWRIKINGNVIFIGTINLDETTKDISDRLLDRSFVISLKKRSFIDYKNQIKELDTEMDNGKICDNFDLFNTWKSKSEPVLAFTDHELNFLDELHTIIAKYDEQKGVSFRVLKNMGNYINNIPKQDNVSMIKRSEAFDVVLKQTVMRKLSGAEIKMAPLVGKVSGIGETPHESLILDLMDKYSDISEFSMCRELIRRKA